MAASTAPRQVGKRLRLGLAFALFAALALSIAPSTPLGAVEIEGLHSQGASDLDARTGSVAPTSDQLASVAALNAHATWNRFGTPQSLIKYGGYLATGLGADPVAAATSFISSNRGLFRLSAQGLANLELLNDSPMTGSEGHAVIFRQRFGNLPSAQDGLITVGVVNGNVAYASSSSAGDGNAPEAATLTPVEAWLRAANDLGRPVTAADVLTTPKSDNGWTGFKVAGFAQYQRARLVAFPTYTQGVRPAYETVVLDVQGGAATAYTEIVDGVTGEIWFRQNRTQNVSSADTFSGSYTPTACGPLHGPYMASGARTIDVAATADLPLNDIVLHLQHPAGTDVASSDVLFSPEAIHYEPTGGVPDGPYYVQVCPFDASQTDPTTYHGSIAINDTVGGQPPLTNTPKWKHFPANPPLNLLSAYPWNNPSTDTRITSCWLDSLASLSPADADCQAAVKNIASRVPWDADPHTGVTTATTLGNNANTAEAWSSPLTPGALGQRPAHPDRAYIEPWANAWFTSGCSPANLTPGGNDILASTTNLFAGHNRMHDFAYRLGFTESNFNAQQYNFGNTAPGPYPAGRENDPETGNVQAGALTGGTPSFLGRDNANQITLNDGIPPITNQYLFQPIAGAFYSPCVDGDFDTSVFGHEYTHLISNRMVGGPDAGLTGYQAGSMGESWSDLDAVEYLNENGYLPTGGENPFSVGAYVTGNKTVGIRDYALNDNPLNYSDLGFDVTGPEVHADGEIWNGTNFDIRQALIAKYNASFPASDAALQKRCADGVLPADQCPGNRRWIQIVYDAWLLMPPAVSMLDARDAYLAADVMRFGGANQTELWRAFAHRGMGEFASSNGNTDSEATPSFESRAESNEATVTFSALAPDEANAAVGAKIYVGRYQARAVPIADTDPTTALSATAEFVPGTYDFIAQAPGYGAFRFTRTFTANQTSTVLALMPTNWASSTKGSTASGDGSSLGGLIDDDEATQWSATGRTPTVAGTQVTVKLGGGSHTVTHVQVSALLSSGQNRFGALRGFEIWTCTASAANGNCATGFTRIYTSPADAFPGVAPRPVAPDLTLRDFDVPDTSATDVRLVVLTNQCTGGPAYQGDQDPGDPLNNSDCVSGSSRGNEVRAAELQVFSGAGAVGQPDLQVTSITRTSTTLAATVLNAGNTAAGTSSTEFVADGSVLGVVSTPALPAGGSTTVSVPWRPRRGTHVVVVTADKQNQIEESNEANNSTTQTFVIR